MVACCTRYGDDVLAFGESDKTLDAAAFSDGNDTAGCGCGCVLDGSWRCCGGLNGRGLGDCHDALLGALADCDEVLTLCYSGETEICALGDCHDGLVLTDGSYTCGPPDCDCDHFGASRCRG